MMKTLSLTILSLAACVDSTGVPAAPRPLLFHAEILTQGTEQAASPPSEKRLLASDGLLLDEIWNELPADGSCDGLADPAAFTASIPAGTCVDAACTLTDGTVVRFGGCN